jgi:hypothetical protein
MAKKRASQDGVNKSAAVREILDKDPQTPTLEIISTLAQRGIKVHPNLVYLIKSKAKAGRRKQKRQKALENSRDFGVANPVELILEVRKIAVKAGGLRHLKQLVDVLAD